MRRVHAEADIAARLAFARNRGQNGGMGDIVNLRHARKQRARETARQEARQNRARHGRTAIEKSEDRRHSERAEAALSGKLLADDADMPRDRS